MANVKPDYWNWSKDKLIDEIVMLRDALHMAANEIHKCHIQNRAIMKRVKGLDQIRVYLHG
jgi:hypothetical protein